MKAFLDTKQPELAALLNKVKLLQQLNAQVLPILDENIRDYCQVANVYGNKLVILAANGSVATQLKFQITDLLRKFKLNPTLTKIQEIQCKVSPLMKVPAGKKGAKSRKMPPLTAETAAIVTDIAKSLEDPRLREIMEKIAKKT